MLMLVMVSVTQSVTNVGVFNKKQESELMYNASVNKTHAPCVSVITYNTVDCFGWWQYQHHTHTNQNLSC